MTYKKHEKYCKDPRCPGGKFPGGAPVCSYWKEVQRVENSEKNKQK